MLFYYSYDYKHSHNKLTVLIYKFRSANTSAYNSYGVTVVQSYIDERGYADDISQLDDDYFKAETATLQVC